MVVDLFRFVQFDVGGNGIAAAVPIGWAASLALVPVALGVNSVDNSEILFSIGGVNPVDRHANARHFGAFVGASPAMSLPYF